MIIDDRTRARDALVRRLPLLERRYAVIFDGRSIAWHADRATAVLDGQALDCPVWDCVERKWI
jgi:hypothetical protein